LQNEIETVGDHTESRIFRDQSAQATLFIAAIRRPEDADREALDRLRHRGNIVASAGRTCEEFAASPSNLCVRLFADTHGLTANGDRA
jgi:hypothetical protein